MKRLGAGKRLWALAAVLLACLVALAALQAGSFLVVDAPQPSDVILVLAGETERRPELGLQLLAKGYGRRIVLDVPADTKIYGFTQIQLAQKYVQELPQGVQVSICPISGLSTRDESKEAGECMARDGGKRVLIVTSDFHTRRALSVFRREIPGPDYSIAAARDDNQFGVKWWTHRQWAKTFLNEWTRLIWWSVVDQWR